MYQEGTYENEYGATLVDIEAQALITYLGGGLIGHVFGTCPLWSFGTARSYCNTPNTPFELVAQQPQFAGLGRRGEDRPAHALAPMVDDGS